MPISLFPHNQKAYDAAVSMLRDTGRAAVIHPTGTGKSFIGFQLCEQFPDAVVCWLSPSEYIFQTQLENLAATGAAVPENIRFYTYAKLMLMTGEELAAIRPDYIILDEFHRCGAEMWGRGVRTLLARYPDAPVLGLSATNIRYLDNQRDMAEELFGGSIASEMTLGGAIVAGILSPPTYVLSLYSYQKNLENYQQRVRRAKTQAVRDEAQRYLDALRRALEQSEGLDAVFARHIPRPDGKYIVFCANASHMDEMIAHVPEWFGSIDRAPHVYRAYAEDPDTTRAFAAFKGDVSGHLKLLFCIDMLNEGVHIQNVDGVILFRPTVSPIIYQQQIGRALSASKTGNAVIFDIVDNIENLYSIGALEREMGEAAACYRLTGESRRIVNERFRIVDEARDCRQLFEALNNTLSASWELMYGLAKAYFEAHGDLLVSRRYRTPEGYSLGAWLNTQRRVRAGETYGRLDQARIRRLDEIGMVWDSPRDSAWARNFAEARRYFHTHGDLNASADYVSPAGVRLGAWLCQLRTYRKAGVQQSYLTAGRIRCLDELHMVWDVPDYLWERNFHAAMVYHRAHGHLNVPAGYVSEDGVQLGAWLRRLRRLRTGKGKGAPLTQDQIRRLDELGMAWEDKLTRQWERGCREAEAYFEAHGDLNVPSSYVTSSGFKLGAWIANHREARGIKVTPERKQRLDAIGMIWSKPDPWEERFALARDYYEAHGNLLVPTDYKANGVWLAKWLNEQRQIYLGRRKGKTLTRDQIRRLEAISFDWPSAKERAWRDHYAEAAKVFAATGSLDRPERIAAPAALKRWFSAQRRARREGGLTQEQIRLLDELGFSWAAGTGQNRSLTELHHFGGAYDQRKDMALLSHDAWRGEEVHPGGL